MKEKNKTQNKQNKKFAKGFTLLELLVVVLIIGILAAIALPQYKKAVEKARMTEAIMMVEKIAESQHRYFLVNNSYTRDINELDIDVPGNDYLENGINAKRSKFFIFKASNHSGTQNLIAAASRLKKGSTSGTKYILGIQINGNKNCYVYDGVTEYEVELCRDWGKNRFYDLRTSN